MCRGYALEDSLMWMQGGASPKKTAGSIEDARYWFRTIDQKMGLVVQTNDKNQGAPREQVCDVSEIIYDGIIGTNNGNDRVKVLEMTPYPPVFGGRFDLTYYIASDTKSGVVFIIPFDKARNRYDADISDALVIAMTKYFKHAQEKAK
jgi:hypothetical protein